MRGDVDSVKDLLCYIPIGMDDIEPSFYSDRDEIATSR